MRARSARVQGSAGKLVHGRRQVHRRLATPRDRESSRIVCTHESLTICQRRCGRRSNSATVAGKLLSALTCDPAMASREPRPRSASPEPRERRAPSRRAAEPRAAPVCTINRHASDPPRESLGRAHRPQAAERADAAVHRPASDPRSDEPAGVRHAAGARVEGALSRAHDRDGRSHRADARSAAAVPGRHGRGHAVGARAQLPRGRRAGCSISTAARRASSTSSARSSG